MEARPLGEQPGNIFSHFSVAPGQEEATDPVLVRSQETPYLQGMTLGHLVMTLLHDPKLLLYSEVQGSFVAFWSRRGKHVRGVLTAQSVWHTY